MHKTLVALALILSTSFATLADITLSSTTALPTTSGITVTGVANTKVGTIVAPAGDFNNDGYPDYAVAGTDNKVYIVLGQSTARTASLDLSTASATNFLTITITNAATTAVISSVANAGDVNGDGTTDLVIGASNINSAWVLYGKNAATGNTAGGDITVDTASFVTGNLGIIIKGLASSKLGQVVTAAGDFNNDGKNDVAIGAPDWTTTTNAEGSVCIVYGKALAAAANLGSASTASVRGNSDIDCTSQTSLTNTAINDGLLITGANADKIGSAIALVGDANGDSRKDLVIGAAAQTAGSRAYIVYGLAATTQTAIALAGTSAAGFTVISGPTGVSTFGSVVSGGGDFNGDGKADVLIGHPSYDSATKTDLGQVYVIFGAAPVSPATTLTIDVASLAGKGIVFTGGVENGYFGADVDNAGDVNGDQITDIVVGAPINTGRASGTGRAYVIYGKASPTSQDLATTPLTSTTGITITGISGTGFGASVAGAGDVTKDTIGDFLVGAPEGTKTVGSTNGVVYEFRGQKIDTDKGTSGSGYRLHASLLVLASFFVALMF